MKFSDMLLSVFLHAGLVVGVVCGLQRQDEIDDGQIEPVFFEILEECPVADTEPAVSAPESATPPRKTEIESGSEAPNPTKTVDGNSVRTEIAEGSEPEEERLEEVAAPDKEEIDAKKECKERVSEERKVEQPLEASDMVRTAEHEQAKVLSAPMALNRIVPVYPRSARRRGREGAVTVEISVSDFGEVSDIEVIAGSGCQELDSAAVSAVRTARFAPATEDGVQVHGRLRLTFEFRLR
jgi:TonB family protein